MRNDESGTKRGRVGFQRRSAPLAESTAPTPTEIISLKKTVKKSTCDIYVLCRVKSAFFVAHGHKHS